MRSAGSSPLFATGARDTEILPAELGRHLDDVAAAIAADRPRRVLLVPPDHTRLHSHGGEIAAHLDRVLRSDGIAVDVMPALGTHRPLGQVEAQLLFGDAIPAGRLLEHRWRDDVTMIGEIPADEVDSIAGCSLGLSLPVTVNSALVDGRYDLVVAAGQVVPHEVAGFGGYTKHVCIGLGGREMIHRTHFVGAVHGIEETLGRVETPVRQLIDTSFDRFLEQRCRTLFVLTVVDSEGDGGTLRGLFVGEGGTGSSGGAAFAAAATLATEVNITAVPEPFEVCVAYMNPLEFHSTWLANKAIYRTRLAMADDGELIVVAPGVRRFGEDEAIDALIRRHGYRGRDAALLAMHEDPQLAGNLAAVAHLIHGSTEGRFTVRYCPGPELSRADVEGAGFAYLAPEDARARFGAVESASGPSLDSDGRRFVAIANTGLGLWRRDSPRVAGAT